MYKVSKVEYENKKFNITLTKNIKAIRKADRPGKIKKQMATVTSPNKAKIEQIIADLKAIQENEENSELTNDSIVEECGNAISDLEDINFETEVDDDDDEDEAAGE